MSINVKMSRAIRVLTNYECAITRIEPEEEDSRAQEGIFFSLYSSPSIRDKKNKTFFYYYFFFTVLIPYDIDVRTSVNHNTFCTYDNNNNNNRTYGNDIYTGRWGYLKVFFFPPLLEEHRVRLYRPLGRNGLT